MVNMLSNAQVETQKNIYNEQFKQMMNISVVNDLLFKYNEETDSYTCDIIKLNKVYVEYRSDLIKISNTSDVLHLNLDIQHKLIQTY